MLNDHVALTVFLLGHAGAERVFNVVSPWTPLKADKVNRWKKVHEKRAQGSKVRPHLVARCELWRL